jgi:hypothetical protein
MLAVSRLSPKVNRICMSSISSSPARVVVAPAGCGDAVALATLSLSTSAGSVLGGQPASAVDASTVIGAAHQTR